MRNIFLQTVIWFISLCAFGQSANDKNILQIYPPNAYSMARYGDIPVDYSTGVPDISIPLMSISDKDITVNVSLSYHARGIKVDQEASYVGLGWTLNAGGMITREIRGKADDNGQERPVIKDFEPDNSSTANYNRSLDTYQTDLISKSQLIIHNGDGADGETDIYYYNFNGRSGKFFLDNNNNVCLFKQEDIKIDKNNFTITDESGLVYTFGQSASIIQDGKLYYTSWYLTQITSPSGGLITFEYERPSTIATKRAQSTCFIDATKTTTSLTVDELINHAGELAISNVVEPLLTKITTGASHYISFTNLAGNRQDSWNNSGKCLGQIALYNAQNQLQKGIEFIYKYFTANTARRYKNSRNVEVSAYNYLNYRLRLESVREFSYPYSRSYAYQFKYYGDDNAATDDVYTLPYRLSPSQDHWGYYNFSNNKVIFPGNSNSDYKYIQADPWFDWCYGDYNYAAHLATQSHTVYGADREPHTEAVKACTLNKIIYPTGGYTQFDFEVNKDGGTVRGGLRVKQIETCDDNGNISKKKYSYAGFSNDMLYVDVNRNYYFTYYYNPFLYIDPFNTPDLTYKFNTIRNVLAGMGVPPALIYSSGYNIRINNTGIYLKVVKIDGSSPLRLGAEGETAYSQVTEEIEGLGRTEYYYSNYSTQYDGSAVTGPDNHVKYDAFVSGRIMALDDQPWHYKNYVSTTSTSFTYPYPSSIDYGWKSRLLTNKRTYDAGENLVAEDSIFYVTKVTHLIPNIKVFQMSDYEYSYTRSYTVGGMANISKEVNRQYVDKKVIRTSKEYKYTSPFHNKATEIITSLGRGESITEKYYYPAEYGSYYANFLKKHILYPVDIRSYRGSKLISGMQVEYDTIIGLPKVYYQYEKMGTDIAFNPSDPFTFTPCLWNTYNKTNQLTSQETREDTTSYLWGYGGQYPIAKIENAVYTNVEKVLTEKTTKSLASALIPLAADLDSLNALRTKLPSALVTTYTYKPLVGMLSATDPQGATTYYEYDSFGRLQCVYVEEPDSSGRIQRKVAQYYDYHYRNQ